MKEFFNTVVDGQKLVTTNGEVFEAIHPHTNTDEPDEPFIVYDKEGNSYFEEDIDVEKTKQLALAEKETTESTDDDGDRIVFAKFRLPKDAKRVQAALVYTTLDDPQTPADWGQQIPAEITIAAPNKLNYLAFTPGDPNANIKHLAHALMDDLWNDGFNTCLEIFMTGEMPRVHKPAPEL
jgi:hypothetical protein